MAENGEATVAEGSKYAGLSIDEIAADIEGPAKTGNPKKKGKGRRN